MATVQSCDMAGVMSRVQQRLHTCLFRVADQLKSLGDAIDSVRGGQGGSVMVYGQKSDGSSALVDHALEKYANGVNTQHLWLSRFGTEANALQTLLDSEASKEPRIIVVDAADELVCKSKQALLYRLLDRAKTAPWLVLLILTNQDSISALEKRVRSRLPNVHVCPGERIDREEWGRLLEGLLREEEEQGDGGEKPKPVAAAAAKSKRGKENKKRKVEEKEEEGGKEGEEQRVWAEFVARFLADPEVRLLQQRLYKYSSHMAVVKRALGVWLVLAEPSDVAEAMNPSSDVDVSRAAFRRVVEDFRSAVNGTAPPRDDVEMAMTNISHRSLCVLAAAARRLRCNPAGKFAYRDIAIDFKHQCNHVDKRMLPDAELQTFKELDRLCELRLLAAVGSATTAHSYRQIALNCPLQLLLSNVRAACPNSALKEWFESQPIS